MMKEAPANVDSFYQWASHNAAPASLSYTRLVRLTDFVLVEFARAWQERSSASVVDPEIVAEVVADPACADAPDDDARLVLYAQRLLERRIDDEGVGAVRALQRGLTAAWWLAPLAGLLLGGALLEASLPPNDVRPVNVFVVLAEGVLLPTLFLLLTLGATAGGAGVARRIHWLRPAMALLRRRALDTDVGSLADRVLQRSGVAGPTLASLSHLVWIGALTAMVVVAAFRFTFDDYLFCWSSTLPVTGDGVRAAFDLLAAPVGWIPGVDAPSPEQVRVSQYASLDGVWGATTGDGARDDALRKGWYALLLAVVAAWGLLPRVIALGFARTRVARGIAAATAAPSHRRTVAALHAQLTTERVGSWTAPPDQLPAPRSGGGAARPGEGLDLVGFGTAAPEASALERLGLAKLGLSGVVRTVEDDESDAIGAILDALSDPAAAPGGAIVAFDLRSSPGRVREAFLRDVVAALGPRAPVHVLLTAAARFRAGPRGGAFAARLASWVEVAERAGVSADRIRTDDDGGA